MAFLSNSVFGIPEVPVKQEPTVIEWAPDAIKPPPPPKLSDAERVAGLLEIVEKQQVLLQDLTNRLAELDMANASLVNEMMKTKGIGPYAGQRQEQQAPKSTPTLEQFMDVLSLLNLSGKAPVQIEASGSSRSTAKRRIVTKKKGTAAKKRRR